MITYNKDNNCFKCTLLSTSHDSDQSATSSDRFIYRRTTSRNLLLNTQMSLYMFVRVLQTHMYTSVAANETFKYNGSSKFPLYTTRGVVNIIIFVTNQRFTLCNIKVTSLSIHTIYFMINKILSKKKKKKKSVCSLMTCHNPVTHEVRRQEFCFSSPPSFTLSTLFHFGPCINACRLLRQITTLICDQTLVAPLQSSRTYATSKTGLTAKQYQNSCHSAHIKLSITGYPNVAMGDNLIYNFASAQKVVRRPTVVFCFVLRMSLPHPLQVTHTNRALSLKEEKISPLTHRA